METKKEIDELKTIEGVINRHLYLICGTITLFVMAMILIEFFTRGIFSPTRIHVFYLGVLIIYSLHKELLRWLGEREIERQGEYFVYVWIALTTFLYLINFISGDYFGYTPQGIPNPVLKETSILALEILAIFILTRGLKILKIFLIEQKSKNK